MTTNLHSNIRRVSIVINGLPTLERRFYAQHHNDINLSHSYSSKFKSSALKTHVSNEIDCNRLLAAVLTLGLEDWDKIASGWFPGKTMESLLDCWKQMRDIVPRTAIPKRQSWLDTKSNCSNAFDNVKHYVDTLSKKKIREMESLEERRLFGKASRNIQEQELIHRAYLAGLYHFREIMALNAPEDKDIGSCSISFASIYNFMEMIDIHDVEQSMRQMSRTVFTNAPKVITNLTNEEALSPMRSILIENDEEHNYIDVTRQTIDFYSGRLLHVIPIVEEARSYLTQSSKTKELTKDPIVEEILKDCNSPPLRRVSLGVSIH